jgi:CRP-like cAMP-binding protein
MADIVHASALTRKLSAFMPLTSDELRILADLEARPLAIERGTEITEEGQTGQKAYVLQDGWAQTFKDMPDGSRQIIGFPISGDCVGMRSMLLWKADHSFSAVTDVTVSAVPGRQIMQLLNDFPRLGSAFLWSASRDEAMVVEHLVNIGRRNPLERTAHFFMELAERLVLVGLATATEFKCPLNQYVLADALGMSAIHVNRVLRELRELELLTVKTGTVFIHDLPRLQKLAGYRSVNGLGVPPLGKAS